MRAGRRESYVPPATPRRPLGVGAAVSAAYAELGTRLPAERAAWTALEEDSRDQLRFCSELLAALYQRDDAQLATLSGQLAERRTRQQAALDAYAAAQQRTAQALAALRAAWAPRWAASQPELDFELDAGAGATTEAATGQLRAFHDHHYPRLRRRYLVWAQPPAAATSAAPAEPGAAFDPAPEPSAQAAAAAPELPEECASLRQALQALEAALMARNALETQAQVDAGVLQRYREQPADDPALSRLLPDQRQATMRYREPRVAVAQARLALMSRIDALLSPVEDVFQTAASREWQAAWPGCPLETNIYAYAGLQPRATR